MLNIIKQKTVKDYVDSSNSLSELKACISFFNGLGIPAKLTKVVQAKPHQSNNMLGWQGIESLTCLDDNHQLYDIDIRYAWGSKIFKQHLVDHGFSETTLFHKRKKNEPIRHKIILYLCESSVGLSEKQYLSKVPEQYLIGHYWQSIHHLYLALPINSPFTLPQIPRENLTQNLDYATTRSLQTEAPTISNRPNSKIKTILRLPSHPEQKGEGGFRTKGLFKHHHSDQPLISVVTVVFNGEKYIEQTIQSVINQSYENIEYIIIDGGSTDKTIEIIHQYEDQIDYWVSEPDGGIYEAMNKGFQLASGNWVNFMNVGDIFYSSNVIKSLKFQDFTNSIGGINIFFSELVNSSYSVSFSNSSFPHQAFFMARHDFEQNIFDTSFQYCGDAKLFTQLKSNKTHTLQKPTYVSISRFGGVSTSRKYLFARMKEHLKIQPGKVKVFKRFLPKIIMSFFISDKLLEYLYFYFRK